MGRPLSKRPAAVAPNEDIETAPHHKDPDLPSFDATIQLRTSSAVSTLADGIEVHTLSMDTLREVTGCLLDMSQEVVNVVLECKKDISKSPEIFELVKDFLDNSLQTLHFCTVLENCLKKAPKELRHFKPSADPFTEEFFQTFQLVDMQQVLMLQKLQGRKQTLEKKLKKVKSRRKLSRIISVSAFAAVIICSVVAAAVAAPPVAAALAAAAAVPFGSAGKWLDTFWRKRFRTLKGQHEVLSTMQVGNSIAIKDLGNIRALVHRLDSIDFAIRDEETSQFGIEETKKMLEVFMKSIENLRERTAQCRKEIGNARTVVLQKISKGPK